LRREAANAATPPTEDDAVTVSVSDVGHVYASVLLPPVGVDEGDTVGVMVGVTFGDVPPPLHAETSAASATRARRRRGVCKSITWRACEGG
jgi:hypothetical protein